MHPITFWAGLAAYYLWSCSALAEARPRGSPSAPPSESEPISEATPAVDSVDAAWDALAGESSEEAEQSLDVDDFSVPDEASFEALWDEAAHPELYFTSPGCTFDVSAGRREDELGSSWFVGAFVAFPLGGPCNPLGSPLGRSELGSPYVAPARPVAHPLGLASVPNMGPQDPSTRPPTLPSTPGEPPLAPAAEPSRKEPSPLESPAFLAEFAQRLRARGGASPLLERLDRLGRQERTSGLLPEVRLRGAYGLDQSLALASVGSIGGEATSRDGSDSVFEARLTFHLDRIVAPQNSTSLERLRHAVLRQEQEQLVSGFELLSELLEAEAVSGVEELNELDRVKQRARAQGLRMQIHLLTGGWFPLTADATLRARTAPPDTTPSP